MWSLPLTMGSIHMWVSWLLITDCLWQGVGKNPGVPKSQGHSNMGAGGTDTDTRGSDTGGSVADTGDVETDTGPSVPDTGGREADAGASVIDKGVNDADMAAREADTGASATDTGASVTDTGASVTDQGVGVGSAPEQPQAHRGADTPSGGHTHSQVSHVWMSVMCVRGGGDGSLRALQDVRLHTPQPPHTGKGHKRTSLIYALGVTACTC